MSSELERGLVPAEGTAAANGDGSIEWVRVDGEAIDPIRLKSGRYSFSQAIAIIEKHRVAVQGTVGAALAGRLVLEFKLFDLLANSANLIPTVPLIGIALLAYMLVLWFMAARTRDRYAFGMALGIGVLQGTYAIVQAVMLRPWTFGVAFSWLIVALAHGLMAGAALHASTAYPPFDTKRPWIVGFVTATALVALGWIAPTMI